MSDPVDPVALAALNNAVWCSIVTATHGVEAAFAADACTWTARTPEGYPDAVTLRPRVDVASLLDRIDASSGCSIKDSFADLDLAPLGFEVLFEASWVGRRARDRSVVSSAPERWRLVRDDEALLEWEAAWGDGEPGVRTFRPALHGRDDLAILAIPASHGAMHTAILSLGAGLVGLSNVVVARDSEPSEILSVAVEAAARLFPGIDIVGYEQGSMLDAAVAAGFDVIGPLRVWRRLSPPAR